MSIETNIRARVKNWRNIYFRPKHALITSTVIIVVLFLSNVWLLGVLPYTPVSNSTLFAACRSTSLYQQWFTVSDLPFSLVQISRFKTMTIRTLR